MAVQALKEASPAPSPASRTPVPDRDPNADATAVESLFPIQRDLNLKFLTRCPVSGLDEGLWARPRIPKEILDERQKRGL